MNLSPPLALCLLLSSAAPSPAQEAADGSRIDLLVERLERLAREHNVPGMALAAVTPDGVFTRGIGVADLTSGRAVTAETLFEIGSITKTFTAVLVGQLAAEGKLDFDDPVRQHVPYFHLKDPEADENVTLRDLLCHRTGVGRTDSLLNAVEGCTVEDVVRQLALAEPMAPFREQLLYNNHMFLVAGLAAEKAGGSPYANLLEANLFDPLGMDSSTVVLQEALAGKRMSSGYRWLKAERSYELVPTRGIALCEPAGAILSCSTDMARYLSFLLARGARNDGEPLLPREVFEDDLWKIQIVTSPEGGCGLGFGVAKWRGRRMVHHDGGVDGFTSVLALLPEEGIGFALLTNAEFSGVPGRSVDIAFATLLGEEAQELVEDGPEEEAPYTAEELQAFSGGFDFRAANQIWFVFVNEAGRLALDYPDQAVYELAWPDESGRWSFALAPHVQVAFHRDETGAVEAITVHNGDIEIPMPRRSTEGQPSVDGVFDLMQAALSPAAIKEASPLRLVGTVELINEGLEGRFEVLYEDENHWRLENTFGKFGRATTVLDGESGWSYSPMRGRKEMSATERAGAKRDGPLSTLAGTRDLYRSFSVLYAVGEGDDERILLRAVPIQGPAVTLYIDSGGNVRRSEAAYPVGDLLTIPIKTVYSDIRNVHGMRLAHRVEISNPHTGTTRVITERIDRNVEVPDTYGSWMELPAAEWPNITGINQIDYVGQHHPVAGCGFLLEFEQEVLAVTAKHILTYFKSAPMESVDFEGTLKSWKLFPKDRPSEAVVIGELLNQDPEESLQRVPCGKDWLLFTVRGGAENLQPLRLRTTPLVKDEPVYVIGWQYTDEDCPQIVYEGKVVGSESGAILITVEELIDNTVGGLSGSPVIDGKGYVVGLMSRGRGEIQRLSPVEYPRMLLELRARGG